MATDAGGGRLLAGRRKWLVVAASFAVLFVVKGTVATYGVFIAPIEADFGWSRTTVSLTFSIYLVATAVASPFAGRLIDRYGPSRTFPVFIALVALPLAGLSLISAVEQLYLLYAVIGLAITGLGNSHFSSVITKWFEERTLLASGVVISGFSVGQLVFNPVAAELILAYDWRLAYRAFGLLALVTVPLAYFLVKRPDDGDPEAAAPDPGTGSEPAPEPEPEAKSDLATGAAPEPEPEPDPTSEAGPNREPDREPGAPAADCGEVAEPGRPATTPVRAALRSRSLWLLVVTFYVCGFTTVGLMTTHFVPYLLSVGFPESTAATAAGVLGGTTVFGLVLMGAVGDRHADRKRPILAGIYLLRGVTLLSLLWVGSVLGVFAFASVYGFLTLCTVPLHAEITADRFGTGNLTTLVGIQYAGHQFGGATAAVAAGWLFDLAGSYRPAHLLGVGLLALAPLLVLVDRGARTRARDDPAA